MNIALPRPAPQIHVDGEGMRDPDPPRHSPAQARCRCRPIAHRQGAASRTVSPASRTQPAVPPRSGALLRGALQRSQHHGTSQRAARAAVQLERRPDLLQHPRRVRRPHPPAQVARAAPHAITALQGDGSPIARCNRNLPHDTIYDRPVERRYVVDPFEAPLGGHTWSGAETARVPRKGATPPGGLPTCERQDAPGRWVYTHSLYPEARHRATAPPRHARPRMCRHTRCRSPRRAAGAGGAAGMAAVRLHARALDRPRAQQVPGARAAAAALAAPSATFDSCSTPGSLSIRGRTSWAR